MSMSTLSHIDHSLNYVGNALLQPLKNYHSFSTKTLGSVTDVALLSSSLMMFAVPFLKAGRRWLFNSGGVNLATSAKTSLFALFLFACFAYRRIFSKGFNSVTAKKVALFAVTFWIAYPLCGALAFVGLASKAVRYCLFGPAKINFSLPEDPKYKAEKQASKRCQQDQEWFKKFEDRLRDMTCDQLIPRSTALQKNLEKGKEIT